jgi:hypothetical protein
MGGWSISTRVRYHSFIAPFYFSCGDGLVSVNS